MTFFAADFSSGREIHLSVITGIIFLTPSSTDFCMTVSSLSPFVSAANNVTSAVGSF